MTFFFVLKNKNEAKIDKKSTFNNTLSTILNKYNIQHYFEYRTVKAIWNAVNICTDANL